MLDLMDEPTRRQTCQEFAAHDIPNHSRMTWILINCFSRISFVSTA